jgi:predicted NUDIX family NTP pyrophosphohydrolase
LDWPPRSGRRRSFPEIDRIVYFTLPIAMTKLIEYQRPFLREIEAKLATGVTTTPV